MMQKGFMKPRISLSSKWTSGHVVLTIIKGRFFFHFEMKEIKATFMKDTAIINHNPFNGTMPQSRSCLLWNRGTRAGLSDVHKIKDG